jgi:hypothetical protein
MAFSKDNIINAFEYYSSTNEHIGILDISDISENDLYLQRTEMLVKLVSFVIHGTYVRIVQHGLFTASLYNYNKPLKRYRYTIGEFESILTRDHIEYLDRNYINPNRLANLHFESTDPNSLMNTPTLRPTLVMTSVTAYNPDFDTNEDRARIGIISSQNAVRSILDEIIDEEKSYVDNMTCTICMVNKKQICLDCGHLFCNTCSNNLKGECFICKKPYKNKIKIYD